MTTKIFVGNLSNDANSAKLKSMFEEYGRVEECDILCNFGFVHMNNHDEAEKAISALHGRPFAGTKINVELSKSKGPRREGGSRGRGGRGGGRGGSRGGSRGGGGGAMRGPSRGYDRPSPYSRNGDGGGRRMMDDYDRGRDRYASDYRRPYSDPYSRDRYDPYARRSPPPDAYDPYRRAPAPYDRDSYYRDRFSSAAYERDGRDREERDPYSVQYYRRERQEDLRPFPRSSGGEYSSRDARSPRDSAYTSRDSGRGSSGDKMGYGSSSGGGYSSSRDYPSGSGGGGGSYATGSSSRNGFSSRGGGSGGGGGSSNYNSRSSY